MAKTLKPTGRKRRFFKKRFGNKRVAAQKWSTTTAVARTLYPPLPAQMKLSFRGVTTDNYNVNAGVMTLQFVSTVVPQLIGGNWPAGFPQMMLLYSRAICDRVVASIKLAPIIIGGQQIQQASPLFTTCGIANGEDLAQIQAGILNEIGYRRLAAMPGAKNHIISNPVGQEEVSYYHSIDNRKLLADSKEAVYQIISNTAGAIVPPLLLLDHTPGVFLGVYNQSANARGYIVTRDVTYHLTFTMPHIHQQEAYA